MLISSNVYLKQGDFKCLGSLLRIVLFVDCYSLYAFLGQCYVVVSQFKQVTNMIRFFDFSFLSRTVNENFRIGITIELSKQNNTCPFILTFTKHTLWDYTKHIYKIKSE